MKRTPDRSLSRREFDAVIRRAAELSTRDGAGDGALTEEEVFRIAGEVGLSEAHVRRALAELRAGGLGGGVLDRIFGPAAVAGERVVPGEPDELSGRLDEFLVAGRLLQAVRRTPTLLQYRPAVDWASQLARAASFQSRKYYIAAARSVEVALERLGEGRTLVAFTVDPGTRGDHITTAGVVGGGIGLTLGGLAGWGLAAVAPLGVAVSAGTAVTLVVTAMALWMAGYTHRRKLEEVRAEVEGVLDRLEHGASLEPPPPSWRRWVKRHFHGVARDLLREQAEEEN